MSISTLLKGFLDENEIPYSVMTHTTAYTAQGAAATMQISGKELAKTVVLWTGEEMILAVLPAPNHVRLDKLAAEVGKSVRLATEQEFGSLFPIASWAPCRLSGHFTTCLCTWTSRWPPMKRLSSTPGRTATRFACGTTTLFVWQSPGSAHSLRKGDANDLTCFSWWL